MISAGMRFSRTTQEATAAITMRHAVGVGVRALRNNHGHTEFLETVSRHGAAPERCCARPPPDINDSRDQGNTMHLAAAAPRGVRSVLLLRLL